MIYLLYLLVFFPWVLDLIENGRFPSSLREALTELVLSLLVTFGVFIFIRQRQETKFQGEEINRLTHTDPVTGLGTARLLEETLVREVARARRMERPLSCILFGLDDFRALNAQYGLEKGNQVLKVISDKIHEVIRKGMDRAFRYGGDEFIILLPEADRHQTLGVAQRLKQVFLELEPPKVPKRSLPASFGMAELLEGERAEDLLRKVDRALVRAKEKGKSTIYDAQDIEA